MNKYIINHVDCDDLMIEEAETNSKAKYNNFRKWRDAFNTGRNSFMEYLKRLNYCRKFKEREQNG